MKKLSFCVFFTLFSLNCFASEYEFSHIWTGDNQRSGAPAPACTCDNNNNIKDCTKQFYSEIEESICFDEFVPADSEGWAHARVFKKI